MELHPILEIGDEPMLKLWYVVSCSGAPSPRVGHVCLFKRDDYSLFVIGGADPSSLHNDVFRLNLLNQTWKRLPLVGVTERYEHCAMLSAASPDKLFVFGGANKSESLNDIQELNTSDNTCSRVDCDGAIPSPRTIHSAASDETRLFIWGGGHKGAEPVSDTQLHVFDSTNHSWKQPTIKGKLPCPRHGHAMAVVGKQLFVHAGMSGPTFHKDLHCFELEGYSCVKLKPRSGAPSGRAAHAAAVHHRSIYVFGGMSAMGALDDMHRYDTVTSSWTELKFDCPPPAPRLDHSMIVVDFPFSKKVPAQKVDSSGASPPPTLTSVAHPGPNIVPIDSWGCGDDVSQVAEEIVKLDVGNTVDSSKLDGEILTAPACIVFGGMDTSGNVYDDVLVLRLEDV